MEGRLKKGFETRAEEGDRRKSMGRLRMETWQMLLGQDAHPKREQIEQRIDGREERPLGELGP